MWWLPAIAAGLGAGQAVGKQEEARDVRSSNENLQREFATMGIQWKVEDAKKAGIHPLAALGAQTHSYQPATVGDSGVDLLEMGQNISRAVQAGTVPSQLEELSLERAGLENELLRTQIQQARNPQLPSLGGGYDVPGAGDVKIDPSESTSHAPGKIDQEAGHYPSIGWERVEGGLRPVPSKIAKERQEDDLVQELMWKADNYLPWNMTKDKAPPDSWLPKGYDYWDWNPLRFAWEYKKKVELSPRERAEFYNSANRFKTKSFMPLRKWNREPRR